MKVKYNRPAPFTVKVRGQDDLTLLPTWTTVPESHQEFMRNDSVIQEMVDSGRIEMVDKKKETEEDILSMIRTEQVIETIEELAASSTSERVQKTAKARINKIKKEIENANKKDEEF